MVNLCNTANCFDFPWFSNVRIMILECNYFILCALACTSADVTECEVCNETVTYGKLHACIRHIIVAAHHSHSPCLSIPCPTDDCSPPVQRCGAGYCVYGDCINDTCICFENTDGIYCELVTGILYSQQVQHACKYSFPFNSSEWPTLLCLIPAPPRNAIFFSTVQPLRLLHVTSLLSQ